MDAWLAMAADMEEPEPQGPPTPSSSTAVNAPTEGSVSPSTAMPHEASQQLPQQHERIVCVIDPVVYVEEFAFDDDTARLCVHPSGEWRYAWTPQVIEPVLPVRRSRGKQLRKKRTASFFTGTAAESAGNEAVALAEENVFTCDIEARSWRWLLNHFPSHRGCHFCDVRDLMEHGKCFCCRHSQVCTLDDLDVDDLDDFTAGFSCRPFSFARSKKEVPATEHKDHDLFYKTVAFIKKYKPRRATLENVWGILVPESGEQAPLVGFLEFLYEELPEYSVVCFVSSAILHVWFTRYKVYIQLHRNDVGGAAACIRQENLIKVIAINNWVIRVNRCKVIGNKVDVNSWSV